MPGASNEGHGRERTRPSGNQSSGGIGSGTTGAQPAAPVDAPWHWLSADAAADGRGSAAFRASLPATAIVSLQRSAGNAAVNRYLQRRRRGLTPAAAANATPLTDDAAVPGADGAAARACDWWPSRKPSPSSPRRPPCAAADGGADGDGDDGDGDGDAAGDGGGDPANGRLQPPWHTGGWSAA